MNQMGNGFPSLLVFLQVDQSAVNTEQVGEFYSPTRSIAIPKSRMEAMPIPKLPDLSIVLMLVPMVLPYWKSSMPQVLFIFV
jgi:hypothetical protein